MHDHAENCGERFAQQCVREELTSVARLSIVSAMKTDSATLPTYKAYHAMKHINWKRLACNQLRTFELSSGEEQVSEECLLGLPEPTGLTNTTPRHV